MDKMKETVRILLMLTFIFIYAYACGWLNFTLEPYETADPVLPDVVTVCGRSISLFSGENNIKNALGNAYEDSTWTFNSRWCGQRFRINGNSKLVLRQISEHIYIFFLDTFGYSPDKCSIYNSITTASTKEELAVAFGSDCIKTDDYYAEIFIDGKEKDYSSIDYPENFDDYDFSFDEWFETTAKKYPEAKYITVLLCYYNSNSPNDIVFYIYDTNAIEEF
ncbi:MAG: hypothetical protein K2G04_10770 [Oscillospiraceae bacterium]|nr:hypothetical protein [Oscillospiraceae bacterium]